MDVEVVARKDWKEEEEVDSSLNITEGTCSGVNSKLEISVVDRWKVPNSPWPVYSAAEGEYSGRFLDQEVRD